MSSANNHKRHTLEDEFQRRLYDAEARPTPDLWARIDHDLTVQENTDNKKQVLFYRQLAAACFVLFALTGTLLAYYYQEGQLNRAAQPGLATLPSGSGPATQSPVTPEAAMEAYAAAQTAEAEQAFSQLAEEAPRRAQGARPAQAAAPLAVAAEPQPGDYYRIGPAYSRYLGHNPFTNQSNSNGARFAGAIPEQGATQSFFAPNAGYSQIITWERVTITMGIRPAPAQHKAFSNNQTLAAQPQSFAQMNEAYQAGRQQQTQQSAGAAQGALAAQKTDVATATAKSAGRWSLNLAYAPSVFEQNIGLPEPGRSVSNHRSSFDVMNGVTINASQESRQNLVAAREEFRESTQPAFSYAVEAKAGFKLLNKLKVLTGIGYSENRSRGKSNYIVRQFWVKPRSNEHYELSPSTFFLSSLNNGFASDSVSVARTGEPYSTAYTYRHLTVPVGLQYEHDLSKDWFVYGGAGVAANFLLESSVSASNQEVQSVSYSANDSESPFRQVQFSGNASVGVGKRLSNSLTLAMGPEVRHYFNTMVADPEGAAAPQGKPYALGMNMSLNYQLGNSRK